MSGIANSALAVTLIGLSSAFHAPASACSIESAGRTVVSISDYNPLSADAQRREFSVALRGIPGQMAWMQVQSRTSSSNMELVFEAVTQNGTRTIGGTQGQSRALDPASLGQSWAPLAFDNRGEAQALVTVTIPAGQRPAAGLNRAGLEAIIACETAGQVREAIMPLDLGGLEIRVPSLIAVTQRGGSVLDFGSIPLRNADGFSPQTARSAFDVTATGGFSVKIESQRLLMRNQDIQADGRLDAIGYELKVSDERGASTTGAAQTLRCGQALAGQTLTIAASLFANAATGKLAGRYRDNVTVLISPTELNGLLPGQCASGGD